MVAPTGGRLVMFDSGMEHEVLPAYRKRCALIAWFHCGATAGVGKITSLALGESTADSKESREQPQVMGLSPRDDSVAGGARPDPQSVNEPPSSLAPGSQQSAPTPSVPPPSGPTVTRALQGEAPMAEVNLAPQRVLGPGSALGAEGRDPNPSGAEGAPGGCDPTPSAVEEPPASIFVSIICYRDPDCRWTIHNLFRTAQDPYRVVVGVVWQVKRGEDEDIMKPVGCQRGHVESWWGTQIRQICLPHTEATGPCKARHLAMALYGGETYVLQVDAHMRFVRGWDTLCVEQLCRAQAIAGHPRVVLSTYPPGFSGEGPAAQINSDDLPTVLCADHFGPDGLLRIRGRGVRSKGSGVPHPSLFWAAGFSFSPATLFEEVPYCPHLSHLFFGEEQYMMLRMWTRGWDVFAPFSVVCWHQWRRSKRGATYQEDRGDVTDIRHRSQLRVLHLMEAQHGSARERPVEVMSQRVATMNLVDIGGEQDWAKGHVWGLGLVRSLEEYEQFSGVDFKRQIVTPRARCGGLSVLELHDVPGDEGDQVT